ncbi:MAG: hypothetical protein MPK75_00820 [Alphaproteobacteria bacterium]|nr:hypothetical protein [Alphaproteobacteria bacterium]
MEDRIEIFSESLSISLIMNLDCPLAAFVASISLIRLFMARELVKTTVISFWTVSLKTDEPSVTVRLLLLPREGDMNDAI